MTLPSANASIQYLTHRPNSSTITVLNARIRDSTQRRYTPSLQNSRIQHPLPASPPKYPYPAPLPYPVLFFLLKTTFVTKIFHLGNEFGVSDCNRERPSLTWPGTPFPYILYPNIRCFCRNPKSSVLWRVKNWKKFFLKWKFASHSQAKFS